MAGAVAGPIPVYKITTNYIEKMYIIIKIPKNILIKALKTRVAVRFRKFEVQIIENQWD